MRVFTGMAQSHRNAKLPFLTPQLTVGGVLNYGRGSPVWQTLRGLPPTPVPPEIQLGWSPAPARASGSPGPLASC